MGKQEAELLEEPAMYSAKQKRKFNRDRAFWRLFRRHRNVRERFCPKCQRPFTETPIPEEEEQFNCGSTAALIYLIKRWGRKDYQIQFGRCQSSARSIYLSQLFSESDLQDLTKVIADAQKYIHAQQKQKRA